MINKTHKYKKAFTLAELMVIMAVMTVVLAAVAPIFTSRFTNVSFDNVWSSLGEKSSYGDIYNDAPYKTMMQESLIGITPSDMENIRKNLTPYSKVIIRSSNKVNNNIHQKQIDFRYNDSDTIGYLFGGNYNLLLGGLYNDTDFNYYKIDTDNPTGFTPDNSGAIGNTAIGIRALNNLKKGKQNSALGYYSLASLVSGSFNTAVGSESGRYLKNGEGNTFIGKKIYRPDAGEYNTFISQNSNYANEESKYSTAAGYASNALGDYNTAIGAHSNASGSYNTAIGAYTLKTANSINKDKFQYNTAIGYKSCSGIGEEAKYKTCIGGAGVDTANMNSTAQKFYEDQHERVFIGSPVTKYKSAATLEVHSINSKNSKHPYPGTISGASALGDSSVIVNGNLIVRGQPYLLGRSPFPMSANAASGYMAGTPALMGFTLFKEATTTQKPLIGLDGSEYSVKLTEDLTLGSNQSDNNDYLHEKYSGREHCICSYSCSKNNNYGIKTYNWSDYTYKNKIFDNILGGNNYSWGSNPNSCGAEYSDSPFIHPNADNVELDGAHSIIDSSSYTEQSGDSCCPILTRSGYRSSYLDSDKNLKNINDKFNFGIEKLSKLHIYNYIFKSDKQKLPHTGVIAQDLKRIFPNSVSKNKDGYYKIRWDEMFYAAINSVKELNHKVILLAKNVNNDLARINKLKKDNAKLEQRILDLSAQLDKLEK